MSNDPTSEWQEPPAKKKRHIGRWILIAVAAIIGLSIVGAALGGGDDETGDTASGGTDTTAPAGDGLEHRAAVDEVTITTCSGPDALGGITVKGTAKNTSSKTSDYVIEIEIVTADNTQIGTGTALVQNVDANQTAQWDGLVSGQWQAGITCEIADVERNESF